MKYKISQNKFLQLLILSLMLVLPLSGIAAAQGTGGGGNSLFSGSKDEACKGANLDPNKADCAGDSEKAAGRLTGTLGNIIDLLSVVIGIAAVIAIILNGLRFITANGDSGSITSARNGVIYALVGLVIVALAQFIVRFILNKA